MLKRMSRQSYVVSRVEDSFQMVLNIYLGVSGEGIGFKNMKNKEILKVLRKLVTKLLSYLTQ